MKRTYRMLQTKVVQTEEQTGTPISVTRYKKPGYEKGYNYQICFKNCYNVFPSIGEGFAFLNGILRAYDKEPKIPVQYDIVNDSNNLIRLVREVQTKYASQIESKDQWLFNRFMNLPVEKRLLTKARAVLMSRYKHLIFS